MSLNSSSGMILINVSLVIMYYSNTCCKDDKFANILRRALRFETIFGNWHPFKID